MAHARLGPSNHRWVHCPGSVREESGYEDVAGATAIDGTGSHLLLELCLINGVRVESYLGQVIGVNDPENPMGWMVADDRITRVQMCLDYVSRRHAELRQQFPDSVIRVEAESRSNPGEHYGRDDWWGTVDITITVYQLYDDNGVPTTGQVLFMEVCDYKDGRGWVSEKNNSQLISYLGGKLKEVNAGHYTLTRMCIVQPKTSTPVRYEDQTASDVYKALDKLAEAANATDDPEAPLYSGKHCQWCKANTKRGGHCSVETKKSIEVIQNMSTDVIATDGLDLHEMLNQSVGDLSLMTGDKLSKFASAREGIAAVFDKIDAEIRRRLETGEKVSGYAMKPGRATRVWNEDAEAIEKMLKGRRLTKDDIWPRKLISPAQALKSNKLTDSQKTSIEKKYVTEKAGAMKLCKVAHGDEQTAEEMFKDVSENVVQSKTTVVQSAPSVFNDGMNPVEPEIVTTTNDEVSFF